MSKKKSVNVVESRSPERRRFTEEFKAEAVQMLLDGHTASSVCERLGLSGVNLLYAWKRRLGIRNFDERRLGAGRVASSDPGTSASCRFDPSHRSGRSIRLAPIPKRAEKVVHATKHERRRELLRQRVHGIVLRHGEDRTRTGGVREQLRGDTGAVPLHPLLQRITPPFVAGIRFPSRVRESTDRPEIREWTVRAN